MSRRARTPTQVPLDGAWPGFPPKHLYTPDAFRRGPHGPMQQDFDLYSDDYDHEEEEDDPQNRAPNLVNTLSPAQRTRLRAQGMSGGGRRAATPPPLGGRSGLRTGMDPLAALEIIARAREQHAQNDPEISPRNRRRDTFRHQGPTWNERFPQAGPSGQANTPSPPEPIRRADRWEDVPGRPRPRPDPLFSPLSPPFDQLDDSQLFSEAERDARRREMIVAHAHEVVNADNFRRAQEAADRQAEEQAQEQARQAKEEQDRQRYMAELDQREAEHAAHAQRLWHEEQRLMREERYLKHQQRLLDPLPKPKLRPVDPTISFSFTDPQYAALHPFTPFATPQTVSRNLFRTPFQLWLHNAFVSSGYYRSTIALARDAPVAIIKASSFSYAKRTDWVEDKVKGAKRDEVVRLMAALGGEAWRKLLASTKGKPLVVKMEGMTEWDSEDEQKKWGLALMRLRDSQQ